MLGEVKQRTMYVTLFMDQEEYEEWCDLASKPYYGGQELRKLILKLATERKDELALGRDGLDQGKTARRRAALRRNRGKAVAKRELAELARATG